MEILEEKVSIIVTFGGTFLIVLKFISSLINVCALIYSPAKYPPN